MLTSPGERNSGYIAAIASGALYGIMPIIILSISRNGVAGNTFMLMVRMMIAALILMPFSMREDKKGLDKTEIIGILVASMLLSATSVLLYSAYMYIPSGVGISIHYTYPIVCTIAGIVFFKEKPGFKVIAAMMISVVGTILLSDISALNRSAAVGMVLAGLSSLTFSGYLIWTEKRGLGKISAVSFTYILTLFSAVILFLYNITTNNLKVEFTAGSILPFLSVGVVAALAILLQAMSVKKIGAVLVSIFGTLEPFVCAICGVLFLREKLSMKNALGILLVLLAVIIISVPDSSERENSG